MTDKGYTCKCGNYNRYPAYVYAHWSDLLTHTCVCKRKYELFEGKVTLVEDL